MNMQQKPLKNVFANHRGHRVSEESLYWFHSVGMKFHSIPNVTTLKHYIHLKYSVF